MVKPKNRFNGISIALHWLVAIAYCGLFAVGAYMVTLGYYDPLYTKLPYWHKGLGVLLIFVAIARLIWGAVTPKPGPLPEHRLFEAIGANFAQWSMNLGILIVLISGYLITTSAGAGIDVLGAFTLPAIDLNMNNQEDLAGLIHWVASYIVLGIATIHAMAALKHHFKDKDATLKRILPTFKRTESTTFEDEK